MFYQANAVESLSARRAWIEILAYPDMIICTNVALRKESVDRNLFNSLSNSSFLIVALRKESVDRNLLSLLLLLISSLSLSARRAWIEMPISRGFSGG